MAFLSDNRYAGQWLDQAVHTQRLFLDGMLDSDGAYNESLMYNGYALGSAALFYDALLRLHQIDLVHYRDDVVLKNAYYYIYMTDPLRWNMVSFNDGSLWGVPANYRYVGPPPAHVFMAAKTSHEHT